VLDDLTRHGMDWTVALEAARKGSEAPAQVECLDDLQKLNVRVHGPYRVTVRHRAPFEKGPISREHDPALLARS
jgi:hypothetical protein